MFFGLKFLFYNYEKFAPKIFEPNLHFGHNFSHLHFLKIKNWQKNEVDFTAGQDYVTE